MNECLRIKVYVKVDKFFEVSVLINILRFFFDIVQLKYYKKFLESLVFFDKCLYKCFKILFVFCEWKKYIFVGQISILSCEILVILIFYKGVFYYIGYLS